MHRVIPNHTVSYLMSQYDTVSYRQQNAAKRKNKVRIGKATKEATVKNNGELWKRQRGWKQWQQRGKTTEVEQRQSLAVFVCSCHQLAKWQTKKNRESTRKAHAHTFEIILHWNLPAFCFLQLCYKTAIFFVKLIFSHRKFFQTYFHTENFENLFPHRKYFKLTFTKKVFQTYFHIEGFSNLLSHRKFFKLIFTQKVF